MPPLKPQLDWTPPGRPAWHDGWMAGYARGLEVILQHLGDDAVDYDTLMGDLGLAFIMQGEEDSINRYDGAVDVGWWPLEPLGLMRLGFVEQTVGRALHEVILPLDARKLDPTEAYARFFEPLITASLEKGRPCVVRQGSAWYLITGCDDEDHPLIGMCPNEVVGEEKIYRIGEEPMPPYAALAVGEKPTDGETLPRLDRRSADRQALAYALALHRDQVLGPDPCWPPDELRQMPLFERCWRTGLRSFAAWIDCLQDAEHPGMWFWNANVKGHLVRNRRTAVRYLTAMQARHNEAVSQALSGAVVAYEKVVALAESIGVGEEAFTKPAGRSEFVASIQAIVPLEQEAAAALDSALHAML